ncbi:hypothetical protein [Motilibacter peucedani]|uniref:hypothetical protein n=1 Tax=Motilibacter peucedani TaxID=598650 RepID=UPI0011C3DABE|nr:hypothetical protein [Motilibacter peucedani]
MEDSALRGLVGEVVTRVRGPHEPGEVRLLFHGCWETLIAYGDGPLARGQSVLVTGSRGAGAVEVIAWAGEVPPEPGALGTRSFDELATGEMEE